MPENEKPLQKRIITSAVTCFLIAFFVVFLAGPMFSMRPPISPGLDRGAIYLICDFLEFCKSQGMDDAPLQVYVLTFRAFWLAMAQNEINSLPFLVVSSFAGPALLVLRRSKNKT